MNHLLFGLRRGTVLGVGLVLTLAMAACAPADDGGEATDGGAATDAATDGGAATDAATDGGTAGGGTVSVTDGSVEITADQLVFDANVIQAPAGEAFTITLVNNDTAPHNISIYREEGGEEIVVGDVINGGETVDVEVPALDAGEYFFVCDIHPEMNGSVVVEG